VNRWRRRQQKGVAATIGIDDKGDDEDENGWRRIQHRGRLQKELVTKAMMKWVVSEKGGDLLFQW